nr:unnamed protein product [Callosobruchus analis]
MDDHTNWRLEYDKKAHPHMRIWTKPTNACSFRMVKAQHRLRRAARSRLQEDVGRTYDRIYRYRYISQSDPGGKVPPWLVNRIAHIVAPKIVENVRKAVDGYAEWKKAQPDATFKPWLHPEQALLSPQVSIHDCSAADADVAVEDRHHQLPRPHLPPDIYARSH